MTPQDETMRRQGCFSKTKHETGPCSSLLGMYTKTESRGSDSPASWQCWSHGQQVEGSPVSEDGNEYASCNVHTDSKEVKF